MKQSVISLFVLAMLLSSCVSIKPIHAVIDKQIDPSPRVPSTTLEGNLYPLADGGILYVNKQHKGDFIVIRYSEELTSLWQRTYMMHDEREILDWGALDITNDTLIVMSTLRPNDDEATDSSKYYARLISLANGSLMDIHHLLSFPVGDEYQFTLRSELANATYGRLGDKQSIRAYRSPDKQRLLLTTYAIPPNSAEYQIEFTQYARNLARLSKKRVTIPINGNEEQLLGAFPTNSGNILLSLFHPETRTLRSIRYGHDGSLTELKHTFETLPKYDNYTFEFAESSTSENTFYAAICVSDYPRFLGENTDFGAFYLTTIDFDRRNIAVAKYAPSEERLKTLVGNDEMQNVGVKKLFHDKVNNRMIVVLEETAETTEATPKTRTVGGKTETTFSGSVRVFTANNILVAAFDSTQNIAWEHGFHREQESYSEIHVGCNAEVTADNALHIWYQVDDMIHYYELDASSGKISNPENDKILETSGKIYFLSALSVLDQKKRLIFLTRNGMFSESSSLYRSIRLGQ